MIRLLAAGLAVLTLSWGFAAPVQADDSGKPRYTSKYRGKSGAKVRGYTARRGGYSYTYADSINTYGDARSRYGSTQSFRDPSTDRQTKAGPFDHGFFFDSGVAPRGGDSPYMH